MKHDKGTESKHSLIKKEIWMGRLFFLLVSFFCFTMFHQEIIAQETIRGLSDNPDLIQQNKKISRLKEGSDPILLKLPFVDDFSYPSAYPDKNKWVDRYVYINSNYPINPVSVGVASFDALSENGYLYSKTTSAQSFEADYLTSRQIDLAYPASKNIYFSFFYQPGGIGGLPDAADSLILDFYSPSNLIWKRIWAIPGDTMAHKFRQVLIPVNQAEYLQKGFRFRFRNLVSPGNSSTAPDGKNNTNGDFWHLDYVRLDTGRNENDTIINDVAFVKPMHSLLKSYQSMPWDHFKSAFQKVIRSRFEVTYQNNDKLVHNVIRNFEVRDVYEKTKTEYSAGSEDVLPGQKFLLRSDFTSPFETRSTDSALFEVRSFLVTDKNDNKGNDTIRFLQAFSNYFAYDDGSPEFGYGLDNDKGGMVAYQFNAHLTDTLVAVRFFFNTTKWGANQKYYFRLAIWADNNDRPGKLIYQKSKDEYGTESVIQNGFNTFNLDSSIILKGKYFVGWIQSDYFFMNVGYDLNNNSNVFTYYNTDGNWYNSAKNGSLMIRPVFRHTKSIVLNDKNDLKAKQISIFPNPASQTITVQLSETAIATKTLFIIHNIAGKVVLNSSLSTDQTIDVSQLPSGFYILTLESGNSRFDPVKFLIQR